MYNIADYGAMISDKVRIAAFVRALRQAVTPGAVVVDLGTGPGMFALLACRLGWRWSKLAICMHDGRARGSTTTLAPTWTRPAVSSSIPGIMAGSRRTTC